MKRATKGAIAAAGAAVLLLGGAGTLAYWTSTASANGGTFQAGHLALTTDATNAGCGSWTLDSADNTNGNAGVAYTNQLLVPGDTVTESCSYTLVATGAHMHGTITATAASGTLPADMSLTSTFTLNGAPATTFTAANNGQTVVVSVTLTFAASSTNTSMDATATVNAVTVTASQVHT